MCRCSSIINVEFVVCLQQVKLTKMWNWLSQNRSNKQVVAKLIAKQSVKARVEAERLKDEKQNINLYKQFMQQQAPMNEKRETQDFCHMIVEAIFDGAWDVCKLRQSGTANTSASANSVISLVETPDSSCKTSASANATISASANATISACDKETTSDSVNATISASANGTISASAKATISSGSAMLKYIADKSK